MSCAPHPIAPAPCVARTSKPTLWTTFKCTRPYANGRPGSGPGTPGAPRPAPPSSDLPSLGFCTAVSTRGIVARLPCFSVFSISSHASRRLSWSILLLCAPLSVCVPLRFSPFFGGRRFSSSFSLRVRRQGLVSESSNSERPCVSCEASGRRLAQHR